MAMAHPIPSYGSRQMLQADGRVSSAPPDIIRLREMLKPLSPDRVAEIRRSAKAGWQSDAEHLARSVTSYSAMHCHKNLDEPTQHRVRPVSPNRMNKPHPPNVFLVTRLKKIPRYFDPEEAATRKYGGSAQCRLNNYVEEHRSDIARVMGKSPLLQRPQTHTSTLENERAKIKSVMGSVPAQATEAWIKLSNDKEKATIRKAIKEAASRVSSPVKVSSQEKPKTQQNYKRQMPTLRAKKQQCEENGVEEIYSSTRWLKRAGHQENKSVHKLMASLRSAPQVKIPLEGPHFHITDYSSMFASAPQQVHYDFQIHPEWHMPWHKKYETHNMLKT